MTRHTGPRLGPALFAGLTLAALLTVRTQSLVAQNNPVEEKPLHLLFVVYQDENGAGKAYGNLTTVQKAQVESYATVTKDKSGKVKLQQKHDKPGTSQRTQRGSHAIDGVVAMLNPPPKSDDGKPGYGAGVKSGISDEKIDEMSDALTAGTSALILVFTAQDAEAMEGKFPGDPKVVETEIVPGD